MYALGSLAFINLIPNDIFQKKINSALIGNLVAIGIGVLSLIIPYSYIYDIIFGKKEDEKDQLYSEYRIFYPS